MAGRLILDAEAVSALARPRSSPKAAKRAQAVLESARRNGAVVTVPAAVLVEVYRGTRHDAAVDWVLRRIAEIVPTGHSVARRGGKLLADTHLDSAHAIDALVVATAVRLGGGLIATHDPEDLQRLAADYPNVTIVAI
ncbi:MAG: type II toxin-antitoxin system VapC family toxin [Egibacteraceae bacterium]